MKKLLLIPLAVMLVIPIVLQARVTYLSEEEYRKLKKKERLHYWENLENDMADLQQRKADAIANSNKYSKKIENFKNEINIINEEYEKLYNSIIKSLGVETKDYSQIERKIRYFNSNIDNWNKLSDKELWKAKKSVRGMIAEYNEYRETNYAKIPKFREDFSDLDNKIVNLENSLESAKPKYYEDTYTVVKHDWLSKIARYSFIYNEMSKWPIIYRANRDQIKDPNLIYPDQVLKIPRGLPYEWKVFKGECLWRIASYPEVYDNAAKWPRIFRANKDQIKDPDLIYPNQIFEIPRD